MQGSVLDRMFRLYAAADVIEDSLVGSLFCALVKHQKAIAWFETLAGVRDGCLRIIWNKVPSCRI